MQRPELAIAVRVRPQASWLIPALTALVLLPCGTAAQGRLERAASGYPARPIRVIVPASPGGGTDVVTRIVTQRLAERLGVPVVIENRGSTVGGIIGFDVAAKATADGYTLLAVSSSAVLNAALTNKTTYDQRKAFTPVGQMTAQPYLLAVHHSLPVQNVTELVQLARNKPGALNASSAGIGSMTHLALEQFKQITKVDIAHIPYKGAGPAVIDLVAGQVQLAFATGLSFSSHIRNGKLRALGLTTKARSRLLPNLAPLNEVGVPGLDLSGWYGLLAPVGTPNDAIAVLNREMVQVLQLPEMAGKLAVDGSEPRSSTPQEFRDFIHREIEGWTQLFERLKLKLN
jgi:tripartite-type tricarboxylate transporter receptor subunit TctC